MYKEPQLVTVRRQLKETGQVSRNYCLERNITRLSAIILKLRAMGWGFEAGPLGGDYVYKVSYKPE